MKRFRFRASQKGATQLGFLDIVTAIIVLAILVYAATWQFSSYRTGPSSSATVQSQPH